MTDHYTPEDQASAPEGHLRIAGSDLEVVAYRSGDRLVLLVNKGSQAIYRATLDGIFKDLDPNVMQYPISDAFKVVFVNGAPTMADTSGAFERVQKHLEELGRNG